MNSYAFFSKYYDILTSNIDYKARAIYFDSAVKKYMEKASLILDLACGTGKLSVEMSAIGYEVIGTDASPEMLSTAMQNAFKTNQNVMFLHQKAEDLDLYGTIDACICALDSINHFKNEKVVLEVLKKVNLFLNPGGLFIFDTNTTYKHRSILADNTFIYDFDEVFCVWQNKYCNENDKILINLDFFEKQGNHYLRSSESFSERIYTREFLTEAAENCGFKILGVYDEDSFNVPSEKSERLIYILKKEN